MTKRDISILQVGSKRIIVMVNGKTYLINKEVFNIMTGMNL